jgi:hypothetical protein
MRGEREFTESKDSPTLSRYDAEIAPAPVLA